MKQQRTVSEVLEGLKKLKKAIDRFEKEFHGIMPDEMGITVSIGVVRDKTIFIEKVKYDMMELSLNVESIEKQIIYEKLAAKYKAKDIEEQADQKKLIEKQVHEICEKNKKK